MTEPNPRRAEELRLEPSRERDEGVSASEREARLRVASESYLDAIRDEARAWELVSRTFGELSRSGDPETVRHDAVLGLVRVTRMQRGGAFVLRDDGAGMFVPVVGEFRESDRSAICTAALEVMRSAPGTARVEWAEHPADHPLLRAASLPGVQSAAVVSLGEAHTLFYLDGDAPRSCPAAGELRALEFLAAEIGSMLSHDRREGESQRERTRLQVENERLRRVLGERSAVDSIVGVSPAVAAVREQVSRLVDSRAPVMIAGRPGAGKAFVAKVLHYTGPTSQGPFVRVVCDAMGPEELRHLLLGARAGEDRGARRVDEAIGGTLFLDGLHTVPLNLQADLEDYLDRVTGSSNGPGRWVAAISSDPDEAVREGRLRASLRSRLGTVTIELPPLVERGEDILLLADTFLKEAAARHHRRVITLSRPAQRELLRHRWPGNVRELRDRIERAVLLSGDQDELGPEPFRMLSAGAVTAAVVPEGTFKEQLDGFERHVVEQGLLKEGWNISRTARALRISRQHLHNLIRKHGLSRNV